MVANKSRKTGKEPEKIFSFENENVFAIMQLLAAERGREGIEPCDWRVWKPEHVRNLHTSIGNADQTKSKRAWLR